MTYTTDFDLLLSHWLVDHGLTMRYFADVIGVSPASWRNKRKGKSQITARELHEIALAMDLPMESVYDSLPSINRTGDAWLGTSRHNLKASEGDGTIVARYHRVRDSWTKETRV